MMKAHELIIKLLEATEYGNLKVRFYDRRTDLFIDFLDVDTSQRNYVDINVTTAPDDIE